MPRIQVLDKHTAELIAAGEVVERPSSVVKELMENAIDAGATTVTVEIRNGGITYIRITDNGCGIPREDVLTAFLRHATSKVRTETDLEAIGTLGFRGEALASIAAVSRIEMLTRTEEELEGTALRMEGGDQPVLEEAGGPVGTTITVSDLFYNVPARMKFLKKDVSEANAVAGVVDRLALSHPEVSFRFIRDGKEEMLTPGDNELKSCIYTVLGKEFAGSLIPVEYTLGGVHVHGFTSRPTNSRANRTMQHFFINGRYVKTRTGMAALEQAYKGAIMVGKFPACVLHVDMPPETVDANVHPAKIEVRFANEKPVFDAVYHAIRSALEQGDTRKQAVLPGAAPIMRQPTAMADRPIDDRRPTGSSRPEQVRPPLERRMDTPASFFRDSGMAPSFLNIERAEPPVSEKPAERMAPPAEKSFQPEPPVPQVRETIRLPEASLESIPEKKMDPPPPENGPRDEEPVCAAAGEEPAPAPLWQTEEKEPVLYLGEAFSTYVLAQMGGSLYVIDKHAAHERLLYNQLKTGENGDAQLLLEPVSVPLGREEYAALTEVTTALAEAGFDVEDFGGSTVLVRAIPPMLTGCDIAAVIQEIAGGLVSGRREIAVDKLDWIYHSTACRAAVKAGDSSHPAELQKLAERVLQHEDIRYCPHGRPVCFELTRRELEKQFGRV